MLLSERPLGVWQSKLTERRSEAREAIRPSMYICKSLFVQRARHAELERSKLNHLKCISRVLVRSSDSNHYPNQNCVVS